MPMIDVYAVTGTFRDNHRLAAELAAAVMTVEGVPDIPLFRKNTAAFVHGLPADSLSNVDGDHNYVRVQVLTNTGALSRDKQLAVVARLTPIVADPAGHPSWPDGSGYCSPRLRPADGASGHANSNEGAGSSPPERSSPSSPSDTASRDRPDEKPATRWMAPASARAQGEQ